MSILKDFAKNDIRIDGRSRYQHRKIKYTILASDKNFISLKINNDDSEISLSLRGEKCLNEKNKISRWSVQHQILNYNSDDNNRYKLTNNEELLIMKQLDFFIFSDINKYLADIQTDINKNAWILNYDFIILKLGYCILELCSIGVYIISNIVTIPLIDNKSINTFNKQKQVIYIFNENGKPLISNNLLKDNCIKNNDDITNIENKNIKIAKIDNDYNYDNKIFFTSRIPIIITWSLLYDIVVTDPNKDELLESQSVFNLSKSKEANEVNYEYIGNEIVNDEIHDYIKNRAIKEINYLFNELDKLIFNITNYLY